MNYLLKKAAVRKLFSFMFIALGLFALEFLAGCATLTTGTSQSITVKTIPPGALCALKRKGNTIGVVNPTPGTVYIGKSSHMISVICTKKNYLKTAAIIKPHLQAMTFGNILLGGLIGAAVDVGTGAMDKYPSTLNVILPPSKFATEEQKASYYNKLKTAYLTKINKQIKNISQNCGDDKDSCQYKINEIKKKEKAGLAELKHKEQLSVIEK